MNQPNRAATPEVALIKQIKLPQANTALSENGIPVFYFKGGPEQLIRVELIFNAGLAAQQQKLVGFATNSLITEGTQKLTGAEIAEMFDNYGSYIQTKCSVDDAQITLYCLKKHLKNTLGFLNNILLEASFPKNEFDIFISNGLQKLAIQEQKTAYLCKRAFYTEIFGEQNPIASFSLSADYGCISRETLVEFHQKQYINGLKYITIAGDVGLDEINALQRLANRFSYSSNNHSYDDLVGLGKSTKIAKRGSSQATIRLGKRLFKRSHDDYRITQLANMVLGGYFGSRLMKNIREERGLTYGIYSTLESYRDAGCFYIEADVDVKNAGVTIAEVKKEIDSLNQNLVEQNELNKAKNYLLGSILRGIDGPFSIMDRNRILIDNKLSHDYYSDYVEIINAATPQNIRDCFNTYLNEAGIVEIICGG